MGTITKKDIVEKILLDIVEKRHVDIKQKDVQNIIQELLNLIRDELAKGNRVEFREFGIFSVHETPSRIAQNPATLEKVVVPKRFNVRFKQGQKMKVIIRDSATKLVKK
jgi:nucleoid DNA-binding protein